MASWSSPGGRGAPSVPPGLEDPSVQEDLASSGEEHMGLSAELSTWELVAGARQLSLHQWLRAGAELKEQGDVACCFHCALPQSFVFPSCFCPSVDSGILMLPPPALPMSLTVQLPHSAILTARKLHGSSCCAGNSSGEPEAIAKRLPMLPERAPPSSHHPSNPLIPHPSSPPASCLQPAPACSCHTPILHTPHSTLRTLHSALHTMYHVSCILYPVSCILYPVSCILYPVSCILYPVSCILYPVSCILYPVSCILYPVSCILYPVSCILYPVSCILYRVSRIAYRTPHSALRSPLRTPHSTLHTLHSIPTCLLAGT